MGNFLYSTTWPTALMQAEEWLRAHPRGKVELQAAEGGFIVSRSCIDPATGNECADAATGYAPSLLAALAACMREGE